MTVYFIKSNKLKSINMREFFGAMDPMQCFYWYIAIGASVIFLIQTVMTFVGVDADTGVDADFDSNLDGGDYPFQLFSLRNLINFILGFGWAGAALYGSISSKVVLGVVAVLVGLLFVAVFFFIIRSMMKLAEDNTFSMETVVGKSGDVYLAIPANRKGRGKIFVSVNGSTRELDAITDADIDIKQGALVKIIALEGDLLIVEPISK